MIVEVYEDGSAPLTVQLVDDGIVEVLAQINVGIDGRGITSISRTAGTGAAGTTDTYTITYTDSTTSTFSVVNGPTGQPPGILYNWSTTTTAGDPGAGLVRNTGPDLLISETDGDSGNNAAWLGTLVVGDLLHFQTLGTDVLIWTITGTPVDNGAHWTVPGTQTYLRGTLSLNEAMRVTRVPRGATGAAGRGVTSIARTAGTGAAGTTDTYTITYTDSTTSTFSVVNGANGRSVTSIARTAGTGAAGTTDTYTITYTDATTSTFTITNGANGANGTNGTNGTNGRSVNTIVRTSGTGAAGTTDTYTITYSDATTSTFTVTNGANGTGSGDVVGPASAVADQIAAFDLTTGKLIKDGGATVAQVRDRTTHTGKQSLDTTTDSTTRLAFLDTERTKLTGVAAGATANDTDANLRARGTHTGTQLASTISDFAETARDTIGAALVQGSGISVVVDDPNDTITISSTALASLSSRLTADVNTSLVAYTGTGLNVNLAAGKPYRFRAQGQYKSLATTTGIGLRLNGTATATGIRYAIVTWGTVTSTDYILANTKSFSALAGSLLTLGVAVANVEYKWEIEGLIRCNAAGTFGLEFASEVGGSAVTMSADSFLQVNEVP